MNLCRAGFWVLSSFIIFHYSATALLYRFWFSEVVSDSFAYPPVREIRKDIYIEQWGTGSLSTPLLYPTLLAFSNKIIADPFIAGAILSFIFSAAIIVIAFILTNNLFGRFAANIAVFLMIVNPFYLIHYAAVLTESLFTFLLVSSIFLVYKISQNQLKPYIFYSLRRVRLVEWPGIRAMSALS